MAIFGAAINPRNPELKKCAKAMAEQGEEVIIARANKAIVRLVPVNAGAAKRRLGEAKDQVEIAPDFDELPDDFMDYFK